MTFNLKNRPKWRKSSWHTKYEQRTQKWFEGFEKKFREFDITKWLNKNHPEKEQWVTLGANFIITFDLFIKKEILGE